jgi:hypothetical protein
VRCCARSSAARQKLDEALRSERLVQYKKLWLITGRLPQWPRAALVQGDLVAMSEALRDWYFQDGGIYLSTKSRTLYTGVQESIATAGAGRDAGAAVDDPDYDRIRAACSALRSALTNDLASRRGRSRIFT